MRPSAGKMRLNTIESGILITKRNKPVSTSILTKMLVPKPKNALKSPVVHNFGRNPAVAVAVVIARSPPWQIPKKPAAMLKRAHMPFDGRRLRTREPPPPGGNSAIVNDRFPKHAKRVPIGSALPVVAD